MEKIIKLDPKEYERCSNIWDMSSQPNAEKWRQELLDGNRKIFIYQIDGDFIGEGALVYENGDREYTIPHRRAYLSRLIVKKEYRNRGIGGAMVDFLMEQARSEGFAELSVGVDLDNQTARRLYDRKGFDTVLFEGEDHLGKYVKLLKQL